MSKCSCGGTNEDMEYNGSLYEQCKTCGLIKVTKAVSMTFVSQAYRKNMKIIYGKRIHS